jgi:hypothetical protein
MTTARRFGLLVLVLWLVLMGVLAKRAYASEIRFRYDPAASSVYAAVTAGDTVVIGPQSSDAADQLATAEVHARGAVALRYQQWYWHPNDRVYQGNDIADHPDWAFCESGSTPLTDTAAHPGDTWTYLDVNERAARNAEVAELRRLQTLGYDGVFVDLGGAALTGARSTSVSTCTTDPVIANRTLGQAYVGMLNQANALGMTIGINGGQLATLNALPVGVDAMAHATFVLDESAARRGVYDLCVDALIADSRGVTAATLVRPGPTKPTELANAAQVPVVKVVRGVRAAEDVP